GREVDFEDAALDAGGGAAEGGAFVAEAGALVIVVRGGVASGRLREARFGGATSTVAEGGECGCAGVEGDFDPALGQAGMRADAGGLCIGGVGAAGGDLPDAAVVAVVGARGHLWRDEVAEVEAADGVAPGGGEDDEVAGLEGGAHLGGGGGPVGVGGD